MATNRTATYKVEVKTDQAKAQVEAKRVADAFATAQGRQRHALALIKEFAPNSIIGVNGYSLPRWTDTLSEMERKELSAGKT